MLIQDQNYSQIIHGKMSLKSHNSAFKLNRPITKHPKNHRKLKNITTHIKSALLPKQIISSIEVISQMDIESLQSIQFHEGVDFERMAALAKNQALQVFRMVAGCEPSHRISRQESDMATECSLERSTSLGQAMKQNMGSQQRRWSRPQQAQAIFE